MALARDDAVVLTRIDYSETSHILVLFTRGRGKVRAIAKGARRSTKTRFTPGIDLLEVGTVVLSERSSAADALATVTEWQQSVGLAGLRDSIDQLYAAQYAAEITGALTEDRDPHPTLFDGLLRLFGGLADGGDVAPAIIRYQRLLLLEAGFEPVLRECVHCGRASNLVSFSSRAGGMLCNRCAPQHSDRKPVTLATLAVLNGAGKRDTREGYAGAFTLLDEHIAHQMHRRPYFAGPLFACIASSTRAQGT